MKILSISLILLLGFPLTVPAQDDALKNENARLRNALDQALNKLSEAEAAKQTAAGKIAAQQSEINNARSAIAKGTADNTALGQTIVERESSIANLKSQIVEYDKQIVVLKQQIASLESELKKERRRSQFFKRLVFVLVPIAVIGGILIGQEE